MTDANTAQAGTDTPEYLDAYTTAAADVADVIGARDSSHGDPEAFAATFAGMLTLYLLPVFARAGRLGPADAFVVLDLMKSARIAVGGPHPEHFTDKAGYGLLGLVHTQRAFQAVEAFRAQEKARQEAAARTPKAPEKAPTASVEFEAAPAEMDRRAARRPAPAAELPPLVLEEGGMYPTEGTPGQSVLSCDGRLLGAFNGDGFFMVAEGPDPLLEPEADPEPEDGGPRNWLGRKLGDPVDDIDLLRWALDPNGNPFADLLSKSTDGVTVPRPGVTREQIVERQRRVLDLLRNHVATTDEGANQLKTAVSRYSNLGA